MTASLRKSASCTGSARGGDFNRPVERSMLKGLLRRIKGGGRVDPSLFEPRMPEVELGGDPAEVFRSARLAAAGASQLPGTAPGRHVVIVTPGRILLLHPCPPPGS